MSADTGVLINGSQYSLFIYEGTMSKSKKRKSKTLQRSSDSVREMIRRDNSPESSRHLDERCGGGYRVVRKKIK